MNDLLDRRLRAADPAHDLQYDADALFRRSFGVPAARKARAPRRVALVGIAAVTAAALGAVPLLLPADRSARWTPNAAAASLDRLSAQVRPPALGSNYLYVHRRTRSLNHAPFGDRHVRWSTTLDAEGWTGSDCDDRAVGRELPVGFPTDADRALWPALLRSHPELAPRRGTSDQRGRELWVSVPGSAMTDDPCAWAGNLSLMNPNYVAGLPADPRALLDRLTRDHAAVGDPARPTPETLRNDLLTVIDLPWLTGPQRAGVIQAFGLLPGGLGASGEETVAGRRGLLLVSESDGFRFETVISADAPGTLRRTTTVVDPSRAARSFPGAPLPKGTVILSDTLVAAAVVPTVDDRP